MNLIDLLDRLQSARLDVLEVRKNAELASRTALKAASDADDARIRIKNCIEITQAMQKAGAP